MGEKWPRSYNNTQPLIWKYFFHLMFETPLLIGKTKERLDHVSVWPPIPVLVRNREIVIKENPIGSLEDKAFIWWLGHLVEWADDRVSLIMDGVWFPRWEVESGLQVSPGAPCTAQLQQCQAGEDTEGGDDDVLTGSLQGDKQVGKEFVGCSAPHRWYTRNIKKGKQKVRKKDQFHYLISTPTNSLKSLCFWE